MKCVNKYKLLAIKALQYTGYPYIEINDLWQVLHQTFNAAQNYQINMKILDEIPSKLCYGTLDTNNFSFSFLLFF